MEEERRKEWDGVEVQGQDLRSLILNYLLHHCYADTAKAFVAACNLQKAGKSQQGLHKNIHERKRVLELVREGQIEEAVAETEKHFPNVLKDHPKVRFQLHCQQFVEFIRQRDTKKALAFAQKELSAYAKEDPKDPSFLDPLQDRIALIAYEEPENSPVGQYLSEECREQVADTLNSAILDHFELPKEAGMEICLKHLTALRQELDSQRGKGKTLEQWTLSKYLQHEEHSRQE